MGLEEVEMDLIYHFYDNFLSLQWLSLDDCTSLSKCLDRYCVLSGSKSNILFRKNIHKRIKKLVGKS